MLSLYQRYPQLKDKLPYIQLGCYPTPVSDLSTLSNFLPNGRYYVKRDDESALECGGNKVRKLELEFAKAISEKKETIIAYGSIGSNFSIACSLYAKKLNLETKLVLYHTYPFAHVLENYRLNRVLTDDIVYCPSPVLLPLYLSGIKRRCHDPYYLMPPGCSSPLSVMGYLNAMVELKDQIDRKEIPMPDYIFLPVGTGGTIVGLLLGKVLLNMPTKIIGVTVVDKILTNKLYLTTLIYRVLKYFNPIAGLNIRLTELTRHLILDSRFLGEGYAHPTEDGLSAIKLVNEMEGLKLDPTYTGKTMSAMIHYSKTVFKQADKILFWNSFNSRDLDL